MTYGYLETVASIAMFISGPFFGRFGDRFGAKWAMLVCYTGSFIFYFFLAIADDVYDLLFSRIAAVMMHAFHGKGRELGNCKQLSKNFSVIISCCSLTDGND